MNRIPIFKKRLVLTFFASLIFLLAGKGFSQTVGKITGEVKDAANGEPLPGVNIIIVDTYLGAATDVDGNYFILNIPVGSYQLQASMMGYRTITKTDVQVSLDRVTKVNFRMEATVLEGEQVIVVAERDILHKEISNSQQVVAATQIVETAGVRTMNQFLGSQAGISDERHLTIRGGSADQTGAIINGITFVNPRIGLAEASIPLSAVEQVSLQTGGFSAEYGNYRSGILNVTTKIGEKDAYHVSFNYSRNTPHMKRFGKSLYDPTNFGLRAYMDPVVSFVGTKDGWAQIYSDPDEASYMAQQYEAFNGWNALAERYNRGKDPEQQATPMDLYLWSAWIHQAVPDFDKLAELYPQYPITEEQKQALRDHAHEPEGEHADYDLDFGFGGPLPYVSKALGNTTFYLSNKTTNFNYVQPVMRNGEKTSITMLTLNSNLSSKMALKLNGIYREIHGSQQRMPSNGDIPDLDNGGNTMDIVNIYNIRYMGSQYYWHPTFWQPKDEKTWVGGLTLNYVISPKTFWDLTVSYAHHLDKFQPEETRDRSPITNFGPIWVNEQPYGIMFGPDTVYYDPNDPTKFFAFDQFDIPVGLSMTRRYSGKVGEFYENSVTQQFRTKVDLSSQFNKYNFVKAGVDFNYYDIDNDNWRWWKNNDTLYEMRDRRKPWTLGGYIQDQISLKGMEARIGVRFDYYNSGGGLWPTGDAYNEAAFTKGHEGDNVETLRADLEAGKHVVWTRWRQIDEEMGGTFLEKTKNFFTVSPRIGIAFPVTDRSKFFFNYGHFRSPAPYSQQFMYKMRFFKQGLYELGNPNLEPPRTISYELGVAYNLLDQYLVELSTYYKDISGEAAGIRYNNLSGTIVYDSYLNNRWENDQGFELRITKSYGSFLTGWINFWYVIDKNGRTGRQTAYQDSIRNVEATALYAGDENSPQLLPKIAANISLHTPRNWGPEIAGQHILGDWMLSVMPTWKRGAQFTYNPASIRNLQNNMRWPDYYMVDMKLSKAFNIAGFRATFYMDVKNVFNTKVNWMNEGWCFRDSDVRDADVEGTDAQNYLNSLHLPEWDSPEYDVLREKNPGLFIPGNDKVGDLRSKDKSYINDPDNPEFLYGLPRDIWFGISFNF
jgi:hypothetical protein